VCEFDGQANIIDGVSSDDIPTTASRDYVLEAAPPSAKETDAGDECDALIRTRYLRQHVRAPHRSKARSRCVARRRSMHRYSHSAMLNVRCQWQRHVCLTFTIRSSIDRSSTHAVGEVASE